MAAFFINEDNDDHFTGLSEMVFKSQPDTPCVKAFTSQDFGNHSFQVFYFTAKEVETRRVTSKVKKAECSLLHLLLCFRQIPALETILAFV